LLAVQVGGAKCGERESTREVYTGSTRLRGLLRTTLLFFLLLSALVIAGRSGRSANLPVRAIRWFLGLNEADEFSIPLERGEGAGDR
jgi:hypothetical protein